jgi:hypothetical protein
LKAQSLRNINNAALLSIFEPLLCRIFSYTTNTITRRAESGFKFVRCLIYGVFVGLRNMMSLQILKPPNFEAKQMLLVTFFLASPKPHHRLSLAERKGGRAQAMISDDMRKKVGGKLCRGREEKPGKRL